MVDILHRVGIKAPVSKVYAALATVEGIAGWWTRDASGAAAPGENIELEFRSPGGERIGGMDMEVLALEPDRRVHWRFRSGPDEWVGTDATFELSQDGEFTIVRFGHRRWREAVEFTEHCSTKWATFLLSLRDLVENGQGRPAPNDVWIGNWH
jgi:uncharacterized protein YndB with AHSA1/START domain